MHIVERRFVLPEKRKQTVASWTAVVLLIAAGCTRMPGTGTPTRSDPQREDWIQLFNGENLEGWAVKFRGHPLHENLYETFRADDGLLKVRYDNWGGFDGQFGHIFYQQPFSYYIVAAEYRFVGEQVQGAGPDLAWAVRNNGLMLHSQSAESMTLNQDFPISIEVQLLGGLGTDDRSTANLCTPGTHVVMKGALETDHCVNSASETYHGDRWVRVEAVVLGDSIIHHIVEGDTVLTYYSPQMGGGFANEHDPEVMHEGMLLSEGYIALQAETAPIDYRKVEVLNLKGCMDPQALNYKRYFVQSDPDACRPKPN